MMEVTIDISMYPNREEFIPPIDGFIERINQFDDLKITTFPTSTVVQGEYNHAMQAVQAPVSIFGYLATLVCIWSRRSMPIIW